MSIQDLLKEAIDRGASDLHITVMHPAAIRVNGKIERINDQKIGIEENRELIMELLDDEKFNTLESKGEVDSSLSIPGLGRFRVNVYKQRGTYGAVLRVINNTILDMDTLGLPPVIKELGHKKRGLILVTGPTGSGKSTTLASVIDMINKERSEHILTLEDPIEYLHKHQKSIVNQREIGTDSGSFANALRAALRQDPDIILVGEMRDLETISTAITAAETGHLVLSTLHTIGAAKTIDRIIDVFPPHQQQQVRVQLSAVLEGVVSQQLLPKKDGSGRVVALEIMTITGAIKNLIREGKTHQIQTSIQTGRKFGMVTMDNSILSLYEKGLISREAALEAAVDKEQLSRQLIWGV